MKSLVAAAVVSIAALAYSLPAAAAPMAPLPGVEGLTIQVAEGCGPGRWRGPWGHCRSTPYYGQMPDGSWVAVPRRYAGNGCPPGWWRGPWGHCRNTPYHGRLPGGGWQ